MITSVLKIRKSKIYNILIILSILTCFSSAPYIGYYLFGKFYSLFSGVLSVITFLGAYYYIEKHFDVWMKIILLFMFSFMLYGCWMISWTENMSDFRKGIGMSIKCIYIIGSCLIIKRSYERYLFFFLKINALIVIASIVLFFLLILGVHWDPITFLKQDGRIHFLYFPLGATNAQLLFGDLTFIRIAGYADEPGALALILTYLLVLNEFTFKSFKFRIIYLLGGSLTFSLAFFITIIPILFYWFRTGVVKLNRYFCVGVIVLSCLFCSISEDSPIDKGLNTLIFNRFERNDSETLDGDNRSFAIPQQMLAFKSSPIWGVGASMENVGKYYLGYPSFYSYLAMHGIAGYLLFYIPFFFILFKYIRRKELLLLMAIALNYLQRPSIEEMFSLICLSLIFYSANYTLKNKVTMFVNAANHRSSGRVVPPLAAGRSPTED